MVKVEAKDRAKNESTVEHTFTSGSLLAFLVFGPMIDIKSIGLMLSIFKPKALI
ncbi:MAG: permease, partial [Aphanizomenon sp.]